MSPNCGIASVRAAFTHFNEVNSIEDARKKRNKSSSYLRLRDNTAQRTLSEGWVSLLKNARKKSFEGAPVLSLIALLSLAWFTAATSKTLSLTLYSVFSSQTVFLPASLVEVICTLLKSVRPLAYSRSELIMSNVQLVVYKMHGTGNDFIVVDGRHPGVLDLFKLDSRSCSPFATDLAHRRFGLGFDQLLLIDNPTDASTADIFMRIFNADGSIAEMCGNGIRCAAYYARHLATNPLTSNTFRVETLSRIVSVSLLTPPKQVNNSSSLPSLSSSVISVKVDMGVPDILSPATIVNSHDTNFIGYSISMGNPHYVVFLPDQKDASIRLTSLDSFPVTTHGPIIENFTSTFPNKTNVEFVSATSTQSDAVRMRVWERGAGETWSCGSGACAVGAATILRSVTLNKPIDNHTVDVHLPGGLLTIEWNPDTDPSGRFLHSLNMTGPAALVGKVEIEVFVP